MACWLGVLWLVVVLYGLLVRGLQLVVVLYGLLVRGFMACRGSIWLVG